MVVQVKREAYATIRPFFAEVMFDMFVTVALCADAFANGFCEVNWQTGDDNWGSRKTAEKVGFALNLLYQTRYFEPQKGYKNAA